MVTPHNQCMHSMSLSKLRDFGVGATTIDSRKTFQSTGKSVDAKSSPPSDLLGLGCILDNTPEPQGSINVITTTEDDGDLLSDIFSELPSEVDTLPRREAQGRKSHHQTSPPELQFQQTNMSVTAFDKGGLKITMDLEIQDNEEIIIKCIFLNYTDSDLEQLIFQVAVPKYVDMEMKPASANFIPAKNFGNVTQLIRIKNTCPSKTLKMLLKVQYNVPFCVSELATSHVSFY